MSMVLNRADAVAIGVACGLRTCGTWEKPRLTRRMKKLATEEQYASITFEEDDFEDADERERMNNVFDQMRAAGEDIEISGKEPTATADKKADTDETPADKKPAAKPKADADKKPAAKPKADADKKPAAKPKADKKPEAKKEGPQGVRSNTTGRPFLAGKIIKKYGHKAGVTKEMAEELEAEYKGKKNVEEAMYVLRNAWHTIRAYSG